MDTEFQHLDNVACLEPQTGDMAAREPWSTDAQQALPWRESLDRAWQAARQMDAEAFFKALSVIDRAEKDCVSDRFPSWAREASTLHAIGQVWRDDAQSVAASVVEGRGRHRSAVHAVLRYAAWQRHDLARFHQLARMGRPRGPLAVLYVFELSMQAAAEAEQLRFKQAERLAKAAQRIPLNGEAAGPQYLLPTCVLAAIAYETGDLDEADVLIRGRMATVERVGAAESAILGFVVSARVAVDRGNINVALLLLAHGERLALERGWLRLALRCASERILIYLDRGNLEAARAAEAEFDDVLRATSLRLTDPDFDRWPLEVARCRLAMASERPSEAVASASALRFKARSRGQFWVSLRLSVLIAGASMAAGDWSNGLAELAGSLEEGARVGLFRTFIDEMGLLVVGLRRLRQDAEFCRGHMAAYLDGLLAHEKPRPPLTRSRRRPHRGQIESLTDREIVVLRLMSLGLSNKEIARALDIMPETIKSHAKRIFAKLAAKARTEAVSRANELGIM